MRSTAAVLALFPALASAGTCLPILGTVQLTPETNACTIAAGLPDVVFDTTQCFKVKLKLAGFIPANGHAGVSREALLDTQGNHVVTPAFIPGSQATLPRQIVQTARSTFSLGGTQLYTAEVVVTQPELIGTELLPRRVTEQSVITGTNGQGLFANATGGLTILGNSIGQDAQVRGEVCLP